MGKVLATILIVFGAIFFFPIVIGLAGAAIGVIVGILGAIIGVIAAIFGVAIAIPAAIFEFVFGGFGLFSGAAVLPGLIFIMVVAALAFAAARRRTVSKEAR